MATAPNMSPVPIAPQTGTPAGSDGTLGELFASLVPTLAGDAVVTCQPMPGASLPMPNILADIRPAEAKLPEEDDGELVVEGDTEATDETIATLLAQAEFVPVIQPQVAPPPVAVTSTMTIAAASEAAPAPATPPPVAPAASASAAQPVELVTPDIAEAIRRATGALTEAEPVEPKGTDLAAKATRPSPETPGVAVPVVDKQITAEAKPDKTRTKPAQQASAAVPTATAHAAPASSLPTVVVPMFDPSTALQMPAERATAPQPAAQLDQAIEQELDLAHESEWLDRLARDIARTGAGDTPLRFKLHPNTLGHLQVELSQSDRGTHIRLTVETEAARALIADAQPRLATEARAQGVRLANTEVDLSGSGHQTASGDPRRQEEARLPPFTRTARDAALPADEAEPAPNRTDRYA